MCGIAGAFVYECGLARLGSFVAAVEASSARGEDSFGVVRWSPSTGFRQYRCGGRGRPGWLEELGLPADGEPTVYLHTSRAEPTTEWRRHRSEMDIPPFVDEGIAVAHNGIIANDHALAEEYGLVRISPVDTAIIPPLVARLGVWRALAALKGGAALAILDSRRAALVLCRNFMPLTIAWEPGMVCFASEGCFLPGFGRPLRPYQSWELPPFCGLEFSPHGYRGPVGWGESPENAADEPWQPFPSLTWRSDG